MDFIAAHPNIAASQHLHSTGGVILRPPSVPELKLPGADLSLYMALSERGLKVTEYPLATSVYQWNWPRGSKNRGKGQLTRNKKCEIKGMDPFDGLGNFYGHDDINDVFDISKDLADTFDNNFLLNENNIHKYFNSKTLPFFARYKGKVIGYIIGVPIENFKSESWARYDTNLGKNNTLYTYAYIMKKKI